MRFFLICLVSMILGISLSGCRKSDRANDTDATLVEDVANANTALFEVFLAAHEANLSTPGVRTFLSCATLTADTLGSPKSLIVDFGNSGCASPTGRTRVGKIILYQTGYYSVAGGKSTVYFDSLFINGYNYSSSFTITTTAGGYLLKPNNLKITSPDSSFSYICNGTYTLVSTAGTGTIIADDDEFNVTGSMSISGRNGNTGDCTISTTSIILMKASCAEPVSGQVKVQPNGLAERLMDFGSGTCDKAASATINNETVTLTIGF